MRKTWMAIAVLLPLLLGVQHLGLEQTEEKRLEDRFTRISDLKASRVLPQYIASLFMGSFRAIIVDVLWVQLRRLKDEEHRYFEMVEIMDLISALQPRNPEVWVHQAWNAAYNIANHVRDKDEQWRWIRLGLLKLEEGSQQMAGDPYLKFEIGRTLVHKATWDEGVFQKDYLERLEREQVDDPVFQRRMMRGRPAERPLSPFQLAIPWFEGALEDLARMKRERGWLNPVTGRTEDKDWHTTQIGLNIHPLTVNGNIYLAKYFHGWWCWHRGQKEEAARSFREAAAHAKHVRVTYPNVSGIYVGYRTLSEKLAEAAERPAAKPEDRRRLMDELVPVLAEAGTKDYDYLYEELSSLKREFGGDAFEYNDDVDRCRPLEFEKLVQATIAPSGDIDQYFGLVSAPAEEDEPGGDHAGHDHGPAKRFPPHRVGFQVKKDGDVDLKITLWTFQGATSAQGGTLKPATSMELRGKQWEEIEGVTDTAGHFVLVVEALNPSPQPEKPAYLVRYSLREPVK